MPTTNHTAARSPTIEEIAHAFAYIDGEFHIKDGIIRADMWIAGLAGGQRHEIDENDLCIARASFVQLSTAEWISFADAANQISRKYGEKPIYLALNTLRPATSY